jgi:UDP-N-acetylglucosamine--N-acetylmuramyl-(pentapeptide) pyrophosphoryl-undecaprenol N-acetylglucosamine transferase
MNQQTVRIVVAGGGSGGHVYPALAVIDALKARAGELNIRLVIRRFGPRDGYETLFTDRGVAVSPLITGKVRRYASFQNITDIPKFFIGFLQALAKLYFFMPDAIFSKGGTGALPVVVAGWFYRIPVVVHESDALPGLTNLFSARFARRVLVSFPDAASSFASQKTTVVGAIARTEFLADRVEKNTAKEALGFVATAPLVLVLGGSQGAQRINEFILENLGGIMEQAQILHQTGVANFSEVERLSHPILLTDSIKNRYLPVPYFESNLNVALAAADVVVARAGSNTIADIAAFSIPAILIPITESANDHQRANAYAYAKNGAAVVIEEANLLAGIFSPQLQSLLGDQRLRSTMGAAAGKFFTPDAAKNIAAAILAVIA